MARTRPPLIRYAVLPWRLTPLPRIRRPTFTPPAPRPAVFVRIGASDGAWGWGEVFCNFPQVGAEHRARLVASLFAPLLEGRADDPAGHRWTFSETRADVAPEEWGGVTAAPR